MGHNLYESPMLISASPVAKCLSVTESLSAGVAALRRNEDFLIYGLTQESSNLKVVEFIRKPLKKY